MFEPPTYVALFEVVESVGLDAFDVLNADVVLFCATDIEADVFVVFDIDVEILSELVHPDIPTTPKLKSKQVLVLLFSFLFPLTVL